MKKLKDLWMRMTHPERENAHLRQRLAITEDVVNRQNKMIMNLCRQVGHLKSELNRYTTIDTGP